ncbi:MAG TPA: hypothetical protein PK107_04545 [Candidatus Omnitrophota bacterium]|nr:hypothetical protein [Candidatus Omnitrophota bacterium]HQO38072.1 hypothetical protein [Candidatus Omnitrophota bacterium]
MIVVLSASAARGQEEFPEMAQIEADYIAACQFMDAADPAYGCINNVAGAPTWVVPRENAMAILGLLIADDMYPGNDYRRRALLAADYLAKVQDPDGAWYNQYRYAAPGDDTGSEESLSKSPTQTAEVMIAFYKLGFDRVRYPAMKKAARYLMSCQSSGGNGLLLGGGKDAHGQYRTWRWASDNSYAYQALKAAETWAVMSCDARFALYCSRAARRIIRGIDTFLYVRDRDDPDFGVWRRVIDQDNAPVDPAYHDWINYAPQMLDLPCKGVNRPRVGEWIHRTLQDASGACAWNDGADRSRMSPGYSFQASLCWQDLRQSGYYIDALNWGLDSGLWMNAPVCDGVAGGWIDWTQTNDDGSRVQADCWERFIDTSFYAIAAYNGGYDFRVIPDFLRVSYSNPRNSSGAVPCYLQLQFPDTHDDQP